jgi:opacity protein-like surface antigen
MRRLKIVPCLAAAAVVAAFADARAFAQTAATQPDPQQTFAPLPPEPEGLTFSPFLGLGFAGDYENVPAAFGAALGYGMNPNVSVEGEVAFVPAGEQGILTQFDSSMFTLSGNVLYHFIATEQFTPYLTAGIGMMNTDAEAEGTDLIEDDTRFGFAWNWGAGLKTAVSDRFGLRADLRYFNAREDLAPDHWRMYGGVVIRRIGQ